MCILQIEIESVLNSKGTGTGTGTSKFQVPFSKPELELGTSSFFGQELGTSSFFGGTCPALVFAHFGVFLVVADTHFGVIWNSEKISYM